VSGTDEPDEQRPIKVFAWLSAFRLPSICGSANSEHILLPLGWWESYGLGTRPRTGPRLGSDRGDDPMTTRVRRLGLLAPAAVLAAARLASLD
jgi:hypothetical protein